MNVSFPHGLAAGSVEKLVGIFIEITLSPQVSVGRAGILVMLAHFSQDQMRSSLPSCLLL